MRGRTRATSAAVLVLAFAAAGTAVAAFPDDPPDDPKYSPAEQGGPATCLTTSAIAQQYYLYSFIPQCTPARARSKSSRSGGAGSRASRRSTTRAIAVARSLPTVGPDRPPAEAKRPTLSPMGGSAGRFALGRSRPCVTQVRSFAEPPRYVRPSRKKVFDENGPRTEELVAV